MARITISTDEAVAQRAARKAKSERRSVSGYVSRLIEADTRPAVLVKPPRKKRTA